MKRLVVLVAVATSVLLAGCAGAGSGASDSGGGASGGSSGDISAQFGGDVCSALTKAEIEAATYPQVAATFSSTDTQKDAATSKAVVCQYLVTFGDGAEGVGVAVSLPDDTEFGNRAEVSLIAPPEALSGIGTEAWLVQPAPGLFEVWVSGTNGRFKVGAQAKESAIALATLAAGRDQATSRSALRGGGDARIAAHSTCVSALGRDGVLLMAAARAGKRAST